MLCFRFSKKPCIRSSRIAYESAILWKVEFLGQGGLRNEIFKPLSFFIRSHIVTYPTLTSSSPQESARIVMTMIDCHVTSLSHRAAGAVIHIDVACMVMADGPNLPGMIQSNQVSRIGYNPLSHLSNAFLRPSWNLTSVLRLPQSELCIFVFLFICYGQTRQSNKPQPQLKRVRGETFAHKKRGFPTSI